MVPAQCLLLVGRFAACSLIPAQCIRAALCVSVTVHPTSFPGRYLEQRSDIPRLDQIPRWLAPHSASPKESSTHTIVRACEFLSYGNRFTVHVGPLACAHGRKRALAVLLPALHAWSLCRRRFRDAPRSFCILSPVLCGLWVHRCPLPKILWTHRIASVVRRRNYVPSKRGYPEPWPVSVPKAYRCSALIG